jgi:hypothetical protein
MNIPEKGRMTAKSRIKAKITVAKFDNVSFPLRGCVESYSFVKE